MISKHTLSATASNQKYSEENYQTVTRRKYLHFSLKQLIDAESLLMKIHLLVNFNVWKSGLDIPVSRRVSIWNPTKNCHFGSLIGSSDVYLFMFLTEWKFKLD